MLICTHCGKTYDGALPTYEEVHGYTSLGNALAEKSVDTECPFCHNGEFVEATECSVCGEWFDNEGSHIKVCESCLDNGKTLDTALAMGEENTTDVYINGFVKSLLGDEKINEILTAYVREHFTTETAKSEISKYCEEDKDYFAEWLEYENEG